MIDTLTHTLTLTPHSEMHGHIYCNPVRDFLRIFSAYKTAVSACNPRLLVDLILLCLLHFASASRVRNRFTITFYLSIL